MISREAEAGSNSREPLFPLSIVRTRPGYHWFVIGTVCIGAFMAALDASIINVALPVLRRELSTSMSVVEWVSLVYLLTLAGLLVPFGRVADIIGRRWMYTIGFLVFILGSWFCGISSSLTFLLVSRVLQAVGAALLQSNSVSIITATTPPENRGTAIGIQAAAQGIGLSLGPTVGGTLLTFFHWHWIFLVNIPVGLLGTTMGLLMLPRDTARGRVEKFDVLGALLLSPALVALVYYLNTGLHNGWTSTVSLTSIIISVITFSLFLVVERRAPFPLVDLKLFRDRVFALGNLTGIMSFATMYSVLLLVPFYLDGVLNRNALVSGLYLTAVPIGMTLITPLSGYLADRFGARMPSAVGMLTTTAGCVVLAVSVAFGQLIWITFGLFLVGVGLGTFTPPNNSSVMGRVQSERLGIAGGILNMSRTLGMGLGITMGGLTYQVLLDMAAKHSAVTHAIQVSAFRSSFFVIALVAFLTLAITLTGQGPLRLNESPR